MTATYELGEGMKGTIGIIGPKRMDYDKVVSTLKTLTTQLDKTFNKTSEDLSLIHISPREEERLEKKTPG